MIPALTEKQLLRMQFRIALFRRRGLSEAAAETLADRLAERDFDRDDRRCCLECLHLQTPGTCFQAQRGLIPNTTTRKNVEHAYASVRDLLQRCEAFNFQTPA